MSLPLLVRLGNRSNLERGSVTSCEQLTAVTVNLRFTLQAELSTMASLAQEPLYKRVNGVLFRCVQECRQIKRI